jgi:phage tail-like protein
MSEPTSVRETMAPVLGLRFRVDFVETPLGQKAAPQGDKPASPTSICQGTFSECSGLEAVMEPRAINEGGRNYGSAQRAGRVTFGTVVLKRGLTNNEDLWKWWKLVTDGKYAYRTTATITLLVPDTSSDSRAGGSTHQTNALKDDRKWRLINCLPTKIRAPDFNASSTQVAIEELQLVHEGLELGKAGA